MDIKFIFLKTDIFLYIIAISVLSFAVYSSSFEHLRSPWRQVIHNNIAVISGLILIFYILIGLTDSFHFKQKEIGSDGKSSYDKNGTPVYASEVVSLLDILFSHLKKMNEGSYSSPFAITSYSKENILSDTGEKSRDYKRLKYGGSHINDIKERSGDIIQKSVTGGCYGVIASFIIYTILFHLKKRYKWDRHRFNYVLKILIPLCLTAGIIYNLSRYYHIFGTDKVGQDVLYKGLKGVRTGMVIGSLTILTLLPLALFFGITAGYFKGWADDIIQYIYTTIGSIPGVLLIASSVVMLQAYMDSNPSAFENIISRSDTRLFFLCLILGATGWIGLCRLLRGETLKISELDYVAASRALGARDIKILIRHILPNVMHIILIAVVIDFSELVLAEALLSYVGVGVDPSMESWGNMINATRLELAREPVVWWNFAAAFFLMSGMVIAANLFADAVRDAFDPRLRTR